MSEYKTYHLIGELLEVLGSTASPEEFIDIIQSHKNENKYGSIAHFGLQSKVQDLIKCSSNPKLFREKYEELKLKKVENFAEFIQLLHQISQDKSLKHFLAKTVRMEKPIVESKAAAEMTTEDLPQVRNRLLNAVKKCTIASPVSVPEPTSEAPKKEITSQNQILTFESYIQKRPHLSWDFVNTPSNPSGNIAEIPEESQEWILIEDLLNVLLGLDGSYIVSKPLAEPYAQRDFIINNGINTSLRELVKQILPLASHYSMVQRFVEEKSLFGYGQVNNALAAAMHNLVLDYMIFICQLETEFKRKELNLHKMWFYIQRNMISMGTVADIALTLSKADAKGGKVLSLLHEKTVGCIGDPKVQELCFCLTQAASVPYMVMLETWIYTGDIVDPYKEFLVEDHELVQREDLSIEDYSADYWAKRYTIRRDKIPKFLERVSDIILRAGKYLNVIRQCGKSFTARSEHIVYTFEEREYVETIEKAYLFASKTLLDLLMNEKDLIGRLSSVKHYFLLDKGDFILQFMNLSEDELSRSVEQVLPARLQSFLEIALRMSSANNDPYKEDMCTMLLNYDLRTQMFKILSIQTEEEEEYRMDREVRKLTGLESFTFGYKVEWPISLILNHRAVACYQMIFRHLFYCKHIERMLCQIWRNNRMAKKFCFDSSTQYRSAFALRQRMLHYVQNLEYHMMVEVIEPNWNIFMSRINKVNNVDELLVCHCDFQNMCLEDSMLTNPMLLKTITKLLEICREYCVFMQQRQKEEDMKTPDEVTSYKDFIEEINVRFTVTLVELLDQINEVGRESSNDRLSNLLYRLDHLYYTTKLKKIIGEVAASG